MILGNLIPGKNFVFLELKLLCGCDCDCDVYVGVWACVCIHFVSTYICVSGRGSQSSCKGENRVELHSKMYAFCKCMKENTLSTDMIQFHKLNIGKIFTNVIPSLWVCQKVFLL